MIQVWITRKRGLSERMPPRESQRFNSLKKKWITVVGSIIIFSLLVYGFSFSLCVIDAEGISDDIQFSLPKGTFSTFSRRAKGRGDYYYVCVNYMFMTDISLGSHRLKARWSVVLFFFFQKSFEVFMCCLLFVRCWRWRDYEGSACASSLTIYWSIGDAPTCDWN